MIKPATEEAIAEMEAAMTLHPPIGDSQVFAETVIRSLIARIRAERENTIRECAEVAQVEVDDDSCGACLTAKRIHLAILALSKRSQS